MQVGGATWYGAAPMGAMRTARCPRYGAAPTGARSTARCPGYGAAPVGARRAAGAPCAGPRARRRAQMERAGQRGERGRLGAALISRGLFIGSFCRLPSVPGCESGGRQQPNGADAAPLLLSHLGCCESRHPRARSGKEKRWGARLRPPVPPPTRLGYAGLCTLNITHVPCLVGQARGALSWRPRAACAGGEAPARGQTVSPLSPPRCLPLVTPWPHPAARRGRSERSPGQELAAGNW